MNDIAATKTFSEDTAISGSHLKTIFQVFLVVVCTSSLMAGTVWGMKKWLLKNFNVRAAELTKRVQGQSQEYVDNHIQALSSFAPVFQNTETPTQEQFSTQAASIMSQNSGFTSINMINRDFIIDYVYPLELNRTALHMDIKSRFDVLPVAHRAVSQHEMTSTDIIDLVQGGRGIILFQPIYKDNRWIALVEGVFKIDDFTTNFIGKYLLSAHDYTVIDETNGQEIYTSLPPTSYERATPYDTYFTLKVADRTWWVILHPQSPPIQVFPIAGVLLLELAGGALILFLTLRNKTALPANA
ncbi:MAG TPA: CHASE domain-containing protein [Elusimicrobiota bacterium]|nr:CHASE domain-containing protein [Elusimicrobiota bacterium]